MSTRSLRLRRSAVCGFAFALLLGGCGLKSETYDSLKQTGGGGGLGPGTVTNPDGTVTNPDGTVTNPDGTVTNPDGTVTKPGTGTNPGSNPTAPGGSLPPGQTAPPSSGAIGPGTTIGITKDKILIGIHAPLTGASPLPQASFEKGARNYWIGKKIFGREVVLDVKDDTYKPSGAITACQELARTHFIVVGGAGTDQIQACGRDRRCCSAATSPTSRRASPRTASAGLPELLRRLADVQAAGPLVIKMAKEQGLPDQGQVGGRHHRHARTSRTPATPSTAELTKNGVPFDVKLVPKAGIRTATR